MEQPILTEKQLQAKALFEAGYNCSQSVAGVFWQEMGLPQSAVLATVCGFGGGFARLREVCGAVSGMVAVLSAVQQRRKVTPDGKKGNYPLIQQVVTAFEAHFGSYLCRELLGLRAKERQDPTPSARTAGWYHTRPCLNAVLFAVQLTEQTLVQLQPPAQTGAKDIMPIDKASYERYRPIRPTNGHKGSFGSVAALCGCTQYRGAAVLACTGALRAGAGLVTLLAPEAVCSAVAASRPEVTFYPTDSAPASGASPADIAGVLDRTTILLAGCGLGRTEDAAKKLAVLLGCAGEKGVPTVLDADGLFLLPEIAKDTEKLPPMVLTPHPGEAARLLQCAVTDVTADPAAAAGRLAAGYGAVAVLKGSETFVAAPNGRLSLLNAPNDGLATGGSGDLLAGVIAGLAAQLFALSGSTAVTKQAATEKLLQAAVCGVWLHSDAAARALQKRSSAALLPTDVAEELR